VKQCRPFLDNVRINGQATTTVEALDQFISHHDVLVTLQSLDTMWSVTHSAAQATPIAARIDWHRRQFHLLSRVLQLRPLLDEVDELLPPTRFPRVDWAETRRAVTYVHVIDAVAVETRHRVSLQPFEQLRSSLSESIHLGAEADWVEPILRSV